MPPRRLGCTTAFVAPSNRLGDGHLLDLRRPFAPRDFRAEGEELVAGGQHGCAVDRRQPGDGAHGVGELFLPPSLRRARLSAGLHELRQL